MKKALRILLPILLIAAYFIGRKIYFTPDYGSGELAPNFVGTMPDGTTFELEDLEGQYVLLEFWGSWCGDCRRAHPSLVELYQQYHDQAYKQAQNFEIVGVALETNKEQWKRAIEKDGLVWPYHTAELAARSSKMFEQPLAVDYGIRWTPTSFLINPNGEIIKVNASHKEVGDFLSEQMKQGH